MSWAWALAGRTHGGRLLESGSRESGLTYAATDCFVNYPFPHPDPRAVKTCLRVLRDGGAVGIFPEGTRGAGDLSRFNHGAAYLALVTGAPVVPVVMFGTRAPGARSSSLPPRFGVVDLVYGRPWHVDAEPWPRTHQRLVEASASLRAHMLECLAEGERLTGRSMPGPLPAGDKEYAVPGQTSEWESHD